ncbi:hypothetical protein ThrDRAFT_00600 [Frankia casuarinae]|uniref:Glycoside hydrolase, family 43 n=1 Tax=Frankia casuarinae (strain DSM 45818 / CECT 9043 / HFP020203 / CcI3) TaxID=106370 RepID=Q2J5W6_FRACC|nr:MULTISPECIES: family 43 glycosylhydrolase [Frankia]ABD13326.1 glycoside hydrolase, family 43 [Frankia casuarinae]ETA03801.1 hypothetical protein CcI6DRAFT_00636 [Frankia sp. CcI6]EYT93848.1 hypothetical protein ThrDRAFT_00600 [Frankia casuarinae]KDA44492.1 hypothetical protein BMG523Draft_00668 [Frankia sp. BMG5.23]OAA26508.1 glycosyl hydrolase family 43 [Frankia casuarinae]
MAGEKGAGLAQGLIDFVRRQPAVVVIIIVLGGLYLARSGPGPGSRAVLVPGIEFSAPSLITRNRTTYAFGVDPDSPGTVDVLSSRDRRSWTIEPAALRALPPWADPAGGLGPAAVGAFGHGFVMYYATAVRGLGVRCISAATADSADGPFVDTSLAPFICQTADGGSSDPSPFVDEAGRAYLAWASPGAGGGSDRNHGAPPTLWAARLRSDGLVLTGEPAVMLRPSLSWQQGRISAPSMISARGRHHLLYSAASSLGGRQVVATASCKGPLGPCLPAGEPMLTGGKVGFGPSGAHAFTDARDRWWVGLHSWDSRPDGVYLPIGRFVVAPLDVTRDAVTLHVDSLVRGRVLDPDERDPPHERRRQHEDRVDGEDRMG